MIVMAFVANSVTKPITIMSVAAEPAPTSPPTMIVSGFAADFGTKSTHDHETARATSSRIVCCGPFRHDRVRNSGSGWA
jgi:hypothetical protein